MLARTTCLSATILVLFLFFAPFSRTGITNSDSVDSCHGRAEKVEKVEYS